jgi:hypothetical protein
MGQAGYWDVDGSGIQPIEDAELARVINARVDAFNGETLRTALGATAAFVLLPALLGADDE